MDTNKKQIFKVETETGEIVDAELLANVTIDGKDYAIYTIPNSNGDVDILASYIIKDSNGFDSLADIDNDIDKQKITEYINELIS